jgi:hypothetical protein
MKMLRNVQLAKILKRVHFLLAGIFGVVSAEFGAVF